MPVKKKPQIDAWSYSRKHDYDGCPFKARRKHVDKVREPSAPAMARGSAIHKLAENFLKGEIKKLPKELDLFAVEFRSLLKKHKASKGKLLKFEAQAAVTKAWEPCDWFGPQAWLRGKMDLHYLTDKGTKLVIIDHKTGKIRKENEEQLDIYAAIGVALYPEVDSIECIFWYLDQGEDPGKHYTADEARAMQKTLVKNTKRMFADRVFKKTPGRACSWCFFSKEKEGSCSF